MSRRYDKQFRNNVTEYLACGGKYKETAANVHLQIYQLIGLTFYY